MSSLRALKEQLAPIMDLQRVLRILSCDQTMSPPRVPDTAPNRRGRSSSSRTSSLLPTRLAEIRKWLGIGKKT